MRALTLHQPWAWAICHAGKRIENRTWRPPKNMIGKRIAIHAGKTLDKLVLKALRWILDRPIEIDDIPLGKIVAVATIDRVVTVNIPPGQEKWFDGPIGWLLRNVVVLPRPIPCTGHQSLWCIPDDVCQQIEEQLKERDADVREV